MRWKRAEQDDEGKGDAAHNSCCVEQIIMCIVIKINNQIKFVFSTNYIFNTFLRFRNCKNHVSFLCKYVLNSYESKELGQMVDNMLQTFIRRNHDCPF